RLDVLDALNRDQLPLHGSPPLGARRQQHACPRPHGAPMPARPIGPDTRRYTRRVSVEREGSLVRRADRCCDLAMRLAVVPLLLAGCTAEFTTAVVTVDDERQTVTLRLLGAEEPPC